MKRTREIFKEEKYSDIKINLIPCHRIILSRFDYFDGLIRNTKGDITLDINRDVLKYILKSIYDMKWVENFELMKKAIPKLHEYMMIDDDLVKKFIEYASNEDLCKNYVYLKDNKVYIDKIKTLPTKLKLELDDLSVMSDYEINENLDKIKKSKLEIEMKYRLFCQSTVKSIRDKYPDIDLRKSVYIEPNNIININWNGVILHLFKCYLCPYMSKGDYIKIKNYTSNNEIHTITKIIVNNKNVDYVLFNEWDKIYTKKYIITKNHLVNYIYRVEDPKTPESKIDKSYLLIAMQDINRFDKITQ